jgi:hypothetical protein
MAVKLTRRVTKWLDMKDPFLKKYQKELQKRGYLTTICVKKGKAALLRSEHTIKKN